MESKEDIQPNFLLSSNMLSITFIRAQWAQEVFLLARKKFII